MSAKLSISIRIGSRSYPVSVYADEEYTLRQSARELNEKIKAYGQQFKVQDPQDLLAMAAFDLMVAQNKKTQLQEKQEQEIIGKITQLQRLLSEALSEPASSTSETDTSTPESQGT